VTSRFGAAAATSHRLSRRTLLQRRFAAHSVVLFILWPLLTIVSAAIEARLVPYISLPFLQALAGSTASVILLLPDFLLIGTGLLILSLLVFSWLGRCPVDRVVPFRRLCLEPVAMLTAMFCGACFWYPTLLSHATLSVFWTLPSAAVLGLFAIVGIHLVYDVVPRGKRVMLALVLGVLAFAAPAVSMVTTAVTANGRPPSELVLLGLDSIAQTDDVDALRRFVASHGGAWYERAVAPGLLTNAVWASVMTMKPVREHGVFQTFQSFPSSGARLVENARAAGFHTISVFSDQLTCAIGSQAGFDDDRSGPLGWRQLILAIVQNSSVFLPLFRPIMSRAAWSAVPANHAGTYTYDLDREIRDILTSGAPGRQTFVAAHLTYLHMAAYPGTVDLSWPELLQVARARAGSLRDRTFFWQDTDETSDPVPLHRWKLARLQSVLGAAVDRTKFVERGGRLLVFSDHGNRAGLTPDTFREERYHHVVLASIGLPAAGVGRPTSLADIGFLLGLAPTYASDPAVEFANPPESLWPKLAATARPRWSGQIDVDPELLGLIFKDLRSYRPWTTPASTGEARVSSEP